MLDYVYNESHFTFMVLIYKYTFFSRLFHIKSCYSIIENKKYKTTSSLTVNNITEI